MVYTGAREDVSRARCPSLLDRCQGSTDSDSHPRTGGPIHALARLHSWPAIPLLLVSGAPGAPPGEPGGAPDLQPPRRALTRARRASGWLAGTFEDLVPAQRNTFRTAAAVVLAPLRPARLASMVGKTCACLTPPLRDVFIIVDCASQRASPRSPEPPPRSGGLKTSCSDCNRHKPAWPLSSNRRVTVSSR